MSTPEFTHILENNAESLKPFAITLTRDHDAANDLFQETVYRALANKDKYRAGTNIRAWLHTIMRNIFINDYRRRIRQTTLMEDQQAFMLNGKQATVPNDALAQLGLRELWKAVYELPEIFRKPFILYFEGYKYNEIAGTLGEPLGTVKSRIHFARKLLKAQVDRYW